MNQSIGDRWPHLLPESDQPKHPWSCTHCGKIAYGPYSFEQYAVHGCPPPDGWWRYVIGLGYGQNLILTACSAECQAALEKRYAHHLLRNRGRWWDRVRWLFGLPANP